MPCNPSVPVLCRQCAKLANVSLEMESANVNGEQQDTDCSSLNVRQCH